MVLNHVWGLFSHPKQEWEDIRNEPCTIAKCYLRHVLILAALPALSGIIGTTQIGWQVAGGVTTRLTLASAVLIGMAFYVAMLAAIYIDIMGVFIHRMAKTFGGDPSL